MWRQAIAVGLLGSLVPLAAVAAPGKGELKALRGVTRILILGDSITYAGGYVDVIDAYLYVHCPDHRYELVDAGLPSETVSGLSEPNHAGGAFPRPDLAERLDRALTKATPHLVVACYGMNDGIYYPFDSERFARYRAGIERLRAAARSAGARLWLMTPPPFDPVPVRDHTVPVGTSPFPPGGMYAGYDEVLTRYSEWLLSRRKAGWNVIDIHGPISAYVAARRRSDAGFTLAGDGVHLNENGHRLIAREVLRAWGAGADTLPGIEPESTGGAPTPERDRLVHERQRILTDAWLADIGHKRPGMAVGLPLDEATAKAADLERGIRALVAHPR